MRTLALGLAAAVVLAGCTSSPPAPRVSSTSRPAAAATGSSSLNSSLPPLPSIAPTAGGPSPIPTLTGPPGTLLVRAEGTGTHVVWLSHAPALGSRLTVRLTCVGPGTARVTDHTGGLIEALGGCSPGVVYSSGWASTRHDGACITVTVLAGTRWAVDVWLGNPALTFVPPKSA